MSTKAPSAAESEILQILWSRGEATVKDVHEHISGRRTVGYTTVLKLMQRMEDADLIRQTGKSGRAHIFQASADKTKTRKRLLSGLLDNAFGGSTRALVLQALGDEDLNPEDIAEIRAMLDALDVPEKKNRQS